MRATNLAWTAALAVLLVVAPATSALAQATQAGADLPEWDRLAPSQREALVAPIRDRWNENPAHRADMLEHARRWREFTPDQRRHARRGLRHWEKMPKGQREEMRALYARLRALPEPERQALRERWKSMTAEQRRAWVLANRPPADDPGGR